MANVYELTRALVDIESITNNEKHVAEYLLGYLARVAAQTGGRVERMLVEDDRFNVLACWDTPVVTLSTHIDTVPPFFASREDDEFIWGRGSCDAKGIAAAMIVAAEKLLAEGARNFGLLFVVGEERNSTGAKIAARDPRGARYLVNGEPTENKLALGSKGVLRFEIHARGKMAHSAYPELGVSAIEILLDILEAVRRMPLPEDPLFGPATLNIGTIQGGRAPNVIADSASAEILVRLVGDPAPIRDAFAAAVGNRAVLKEILCMPPIRFDRLDGFATTVVPFVTDIPSLCPAWGKPLLIGPGNCHLAHTADERIAKSELAAAVEIYAGLVRRLQGAA